jgi:hypothetical protein
LTLLGACSLVAQTARSQVAGTVTAVEANQLQVRSDAGANLTVRTAGNTLVLRIPPGETDPRKGSKIPLADLSPGDRVVAVSKQPAEGSQLEASAILVMTRADVAQLHTKEQEEWRRRGTGGTVSALDPSAKTITLKSGVNTFLLQTTDKTDYRRYSPESARFSDAKPSSFAEIQPGDQVRVLGAKSPDGHTVTAEKIVFGTFRQIAATIRSIDAASGEMKVTDLESKKPLLLEVKPDSTMRKLPEMQARMLARRYAPGAPHARTAEAPARGGGRSADVGAMLDRLPPMQLSELKPGDAIMVSTTAGPDPSRATVIMLLAGVEPLLTASPSATRDIMSGWNLGEGGGGGEGGDGN